MRGILRRIVRVILLIGLWITGAILVLGILFAGCLFLLTPRSETPEKAVWEIEQRIAAPGFAAELADAKERVVSWPEVNGIGGIAVCENGDWVVYAHYTTYDLEHTYHPIVARDNRGRWYRGTRYSISNCLKNGRSPRSADHLRELGEVWLWPLEAEE